MIIWIEDPKGARGPIMKAKKKSPPRDSGNAPDWRQRCLRLEAEVADLKVERDQYLRALSALTFKDFDIDKEALLAQVGKGQSIEDLIAELKCHGN
jgi:hypothetical protein